MLRIKRRFILIISFLSFFLLLIPCSSGDLWNYKDYVFYIDGSDSIDERTNINVTLSGKIPYPEPWFTQLSTNRSDILPTESDRISEPDENVANTNYYNDPNGYSVYAVTGDFDKSFQTYLPPTTPRNVTMVKAVVKFHSILGTVWYGWMSFRYNETVNFSESTPFITDYSEDFSNQILEYQENGWHTSAYQPSRYWNYLQNTGNDCWYYWDITDYYDWNISMLTSDDLYVMWTTQQIESEVDQFLMIDYVGIWYDYDARPADISEPRPIISTDDTITGLIWLLIIFTPAIALGQYIPKIGFTAGIVLITIIFGFTQSGFFPVTIISLIGVGILLYKDKGD